MLTQTPRQLPAAEGRLFPLGPEVKVICVSGCQAVRDDPEGGAATPTLLGMRGRDLTGELVEVVGEVVRPQGGHPHVNTAPVLPGRQTLPLQHPSPALPHPVAD